jgi:hypothetical protein
LLWMKENGVKSVKLSELDALEDILWEL